MGAQGRWPSSFARLHATWYVRRKRWRSSSGAATSLVGRSAPEARWTFEPPCRHGLPASSSEAGMPFNRIILGRGWPDAPTGEVDFPSERMPEDATFGQLAVLPTLFMAEGRDADRLAHVGYVQVVAGGRVTTRVRYQYDTIVPPIRRIASRALRRRSACPPMALAHRASTGPIRAGLSKKAIYTAPCSISAKHRGTRRRSSTSVYRPASSPSSSRS